MQKFLVLCLLVAFSQAQLYENEYYLITNHNSFKALEVCAWNTTNGAYVDQYQISYDDNQLWYLQAIEDSSCFYIYSKLGNSLVLDADLNSVGANGCPVSIWQAWEGPSQQWKFAQAGNTTNYIIQNCASELVLQVSNSFASDLAAIELWEYTGAKNQQWMFSPRGDHVTFEEVAQITVGVAEKIGDVAEKVASLAG